MGIKMRCMCVTWQRSIDTGLYHDWCLALAWNHIQLPVLHRSVYSFRVVTDLLLSPEWTGHRSSAHYSASLLISTFRLHLILSNP
ncbi:hypothetical protein J6590_055242 [Homalodisca vitripennis]|nr:hypothetical protein J6590_055242 [Homalodisca vitripennis]